MLATFLNELLATLVAALPRIFLLGAPVLVLGIVLAAIADTKLPGEGKRASTK
jgi:hypothetical protein